MKGIKRKGHATGRINNHSAPRMRSIFRGNGRCAPSEKAKAPNLVGRPPRPLGRPHLSAGMRTACSYLTARACPALGPDYDSDGIAEMPCYVGMRFGLRSLLPVPIGSTSLALGAITSIFATGNTPAARRDDSTLSGPTPQRTGRHHPGDVVFALTARTTLVVASRDGNLALVAWQTFASNRLQQERHSAPPFP